MRKTHLLIAASFFLAVALIFAQLRGNALQSALHKERAHSVALAKELEDLRAAKVPGAKPAQGGRGPDTGEAHAARPKSTPKAAAKEEAPDPFMQKVLARAEYASEVFEYMQKTPGLLVPEICLLDTNDWLDLERQTNPSLPEEEQLKASAELVRRQATDKAMQTLMQACQRSILQGASGPQTIADLAPHLAEPLGSDILERYAILPPEAYTPQIASQVASMEKEEARAGNPHPICYVLVEKEASGQLAPRGTVTAHSTSMARYTEP